MKLKHIIFFMLYIVIQTGSQTSKATYMGMSQQVVDGLLKDKQSVSPGMTYQFVTEKVFNSTILPDPTVTSAPDPIKVQAILDAKDKAKTPEERLDALIKAIDLR